MLNSSRKEWMSSGLGALVDYGSDEESSGGPNELTEKAVSREEVYAEDRDGEVEEPTAKRSRINENGGIDSAVDSSLAEIGYDMGKFTKINMPYNAIGQWKSRDGGTKGCDDGFDDNEVDEENIDGVEIPPVKSVVLEDDLREVRERGNQPLMEGLLDGDSTKESVHSKQGEPDVKLSFFKLANRCALAMKSTLNVRSVQMEEYGGYRVYLRYDDIPICLLSSMGQHESEITARRSAVKELVEQMLELGLFPPNAKKILSEKITTVDKIIEVTKPVLSYLKFQLSDQRYQRMLRDDGRMSIKADCTKIQLELIAVLIDQIKFFTYRFYAEPTNNPWLHLAPINSVAPSVYTAPMKSGGVPCAATINSTYGGVNRMSSMVMTAEIKNEETVYGGNSGMDATTSYSSPSSVHALPVAPPPLATGMKLRIIEDNTDHRAPDAFFSLPPAPSLPSSVGFQSQYVRTVAVMNTPVVKEEAISAALRIKVPQHEVISEIVERTIGALGWTERNDTIMVGPTRKRAYLWVDEVPIALLGSMGESEKLSEAVSTCTHELMEQLCAWSLFPLDLVSQICRNKDHLNALLYSMNTALSYINSTIREPQYMSLHRTQGMARVPLEAPATHQAVAISFRCRVKSFMDKFWETHKIHLGPLIPLPKLEQWEQVYFMHTGLINLTSSSRIGGENGAIDSEKSISDGSFMGNMDAPAETEEYL
ncbi:hypothetical protein PMAYCL1PPCAC_29288 [Pristionchus mayeri]|uniref:Uncharacterized protein n=1 Tax=Pristionchus mayeri TaxID=1317129 RepID=A0AAN5D9M5_9BILA|nr:hypothetical protein PMAYCL1PPCAC_29288 [Pristionchus mayeri]